MIINICVVTAVAMTMLLMDLGSVCWLVGDDLPYGITFIIVYVVTAVTMIMLLSNFGPYVFYMCCLISCQLLLRDFKSYGVILTAVRVCYRIFCHSRQVIY